MGSTLTKMPVETDAIKRTPTPSGVASGSGTSSTVSAHQKPPACSSIGSVTVIRMTSVSPGWTFDSTGLSDTHLAHERWSVPGAS